LASAHPDLPILLGVEPEGPDAGYGWIEPGEMIGKQMEVELSLVRRFWEKPDPRKAQALYLKGCLWNTLILVCQAERLLQMFKAYVPAVFRRFERIRRALGSVSEGRVLEEAYQRLTSVNFSKAILEKKVERLGVIPMKGVHWSDWGDPARILKSLTRWGLRPNPPV
ncbi:MAG: hypothetical protein HY347_06910, partial [candidate division NC10 bacterium]|nr:hypothetical protein [candidate division NC10 bacterium]